MTALVRDLRLAVRVLLGARTWTLVVLLSLALGIGANTALFTAVNGLGLGAVLWAGRFVQTVVYGLAPSDPLTIGAAVALIAIVTALAGGLPARCAANVSPIEALRQQ